MKRVIPFWVLGLSALSLAGYRVLASQSDEPSVVGLLLGLAVGQVGIYFHIHSRYGRGRTTTAIVAHLIGLIVLGLTVAAWSKQMFGSYVAGYLAITLLSFSTIDALKECLKTKPRSSRDASQKKSK